VLSVVEQVAPIVAGVTLAAAAGVLLVRFLAGRRRTKTGRPWNRMSVLTVLRNRSYLGEIRYRGAGIRRHTNRSSHASFSIGRRRSSKNAMSRDTRLSPSQEDGPASFSETGPVRPSSKMVEPTGIEPVTTCLQSGPAGATWTPSEQGV
jgi:hypothetical protein